MDHLSVACLICEIQALCRCVCAGVSIYLAISIIKFPSLNLHHKLNDSQVAVSSAVFIITLKCSLLVVQQLQ